MANTKKQSGKGKCYGIERSGLDGCVNEGKLPFAFPTKELANEWLQFAAKLGADFGTYACSGGMCQDDYSVVESDFGYAKVDSPDAEKNYYLQEFKLVDVSGLPVLSCKPREMTLEQAEELLDFLFIDDDGKEEGLMGRYAKRLLRCLNTTDQESYNGGYEIFAPWCCYWDEKEIVLPEGITEIPKEEYRSARNLETVVIPEGVTKICAGAFYHCDELKTVKFPSTLKEIGKCAFGNCDNLMELNLPDGLEKIGANAFDDKWYGNQKVLECSDLSELSDYSWCKLIVQHPELGERCACWDKFDSSDWEDILKVAPQFAAKCKKWREFSGDEIAELLKAQPQLASRWKSLSELDTDDWSALLRKRPEFADRCKKWDKFGAGDWSRLLAEQPQFSDRCNVWSQFGDEDWDRVEKKGAEFKKLRKQLGPKQLFGYPADYVRGEAKGLYCVIDVSGGKDAAKFPVSYLDAIPDGGWTDEYKTSRIVLRLVAPTTFSMGAEDRKDNPVHQVKLTRPFYIGVFEVTQKQWELVTGRNPSHHDDESDSAMRPVEQVSYRHIRGEKQGLKWPNSACVDKDSFLGMLRKKSGIKNVDLPTEAEWTCACKPGIAGLDQDAVEGVAWTDDNSGEKTHVVGELAANGLGLYDVLGNVWEWCIDRYGPFAKSKVTDPIGYSVSSNFASHGACCYNGSHSMNSSNRNSKSARETGSGLGLRLCITLEKASNGLLAQANEVQEMSLLPVVDITEIDTLDWKTWNDGMWAAYEKQLVRLDGERLEMAKEAISNQDGTADEELLSFFACALKRNFPAWSRFFDDMDCVVRELSDVVVADPTILKNDEIARFVTDWCDADGSDENGYYNACGRVPYRGCEFLDWSYDVVHSSWATVVSAAPDFVPDFDWGKLSGADCCLVLAYQPQLAFHFDFEDLNNLYSELWQGEGDGELFIDSWMALLLRQHQFLERFTHWADCNCFAGDKICKLITRDPGFIGKFSLEELGDPESGHWVIYDKGAYAKGSKAACYKRGWDELVAAHPEFAKYRKG